MLCYRDKTFCDFKDCENFDDCVDALTDAVHYEANMRNMNISRCSEKPDCFKEKDNESKIKS